MMELYQDQYINGDIVVKGKRDCNSRYKALSKIFDKYSRPFTILDIGANFGYYSLRASTEYDAISVMVENKISETNALINLCGKNICKDKVNILHTEIDLYKLNQLSKCEHFDIVLALNVIHHFKHKEVSEICKTLLKIGDNLIIETPPVNDSGSCGQNNLKLISDYFKNKEKIKLGEFKRHTSDTMSSIFWVKSPKVDLKWPYYNYDKILGSDDLNTDLLKNRGSNKIQSTFDIKKIYSPRRKGSRDWIPGINLKTFIALNGVYPLRSYLQKKLENREIQGSYKWDNTNNDLTTHNLILNGSYLYMIDFDDNLIENNSLGDENQLKSIIYELSEINNY